VDHRAEHPGFDQSQPQLGPLDQMQHSLVVVVAAAAEPTESKLNIKV
jgi:hypothetical protein